MNNLSNRESIFKNYDQPIRYIIEESYGSTMHEGHTSWVEFAAFSNKQNVVLNKTISYNFVPQLDITGQSTVSYINNGVISLDEWVSINLLLQEHYPAKILIDLENEFIIDEIIIHHGWWTKRAYKNKIYVSQDLITWDCIYDYSHDGLFYEFENQPFKLILNNKL